MLASNSVFVRTSLEKMLLKDKKYLTPGFIYKSLISFYIFMKLYVFFVFTGINKNLQK